MKVKELKELLNKYDDEMTILVYNYDEGNDYCCIESVEERFFAKDVSFKHHFKLIDENMIKDGYFYYQVSKHFPLEKFEVIKGLVIY